MTEENRKNRRYAGKTGAFAILIRQNEPAIVGQIIDISIDGIAIRYLSKNPRKAGLSYIKLFRANGHFVHLKRFQCNIIYDLRVDSASWHSLATRRCGAKFEGLSEEKRTELKNFIETFIVESA